MAGWPLRIGFLKETNFFEFSFAIKLKYGLLIFFLKLDLKKDLCRLGSNPFFTKFFLDIIKKDLTLHPHSTNELNESDMALRDMSHLFKTKILQCINFRFK